MKLIITTSLILMAQLSIAAGSAFLRAFDVYYVDNDQVNIVWETTEEMRNSSFVIERSMDAINFEEIKVVKAGESKSDLIFLETDNKPMAGTSHYRLKQVTKEGLAIYSPIRTIKNYETLALELNLTPNPCDETYKEELQKLAENQILVVLRSKDGNEYYAKINITNDICMIEAVDPEKVIPEGEYIITASSKNELYAQHISIKP